MDENLLLSGPYENIVTCGILEYCTWKIKIVVTWGSKKLLPEGSEIIVTGGLRPLFSVASESFVT